jgi:hypothetical protein
MPYLERPALELLVHLELDRRSEMGVLRRHAEESSRNRQGRQRHCSLVKIATAQASCLPSVLLGKNQSNCKCPTASMQSSNASGANSVLMKCKMVGIPDEAGKLEEGRRE